MKLSQEAVRMKLWLTAVLIALSSMPAIGADESAGAGELSQKVWNHGSADCDANRDPAIEVYQFDAATFILRQSKCVHFEAPFIYLLFGEDQVFLQDTGATDDPARFPIYETVRALIARRQQAGARELRLLVSHSHSHRDHTAGDAQFSNRPGVTLIEPTGEAVRRHFGFGRWPEGVAEVDLGQRKLIVMPLPGHQDESVAVYDEKTGWLLTGDSLYPGELYVWDWRSYRASIRRLAEFSKNHRISAVLGTHIEMSVLPGQLFPRGNTYQPNEAPLSLAAADLWLLDEKLQQAGDEPVTISTAKFVVTPVNGLQRWLSKTLRALGF